MKCGRKSCKRLAEDGFKRCSECRAKQRAYLKTYRDKNPEQFLARQRTRINNYIKSGTKKARAYQQRHRQTIARANKAWCATHGEERLRTKLVNKAIAEGKIVRPKHCQGACKQIKRPLVAVGVDANKDKVTVRGFVCWGCYWAIKRGDQPLP